MLAKALQGAATAAEKIYIESVFSTFLYTGNGSTQTITNGIDLSGKGGLVWVKPRVNDGVNYHSLFDTARGAGEYLSSNLTSGQNGDPSSLTAFTSTGFTLGNSGLCNGNTYAYASWTFRKAAKFFDVVTYTGNGSNRTIAHNLGSVPGCIIIKPTSYSDNWTVYHRSTGITSKLYLNSTSATIGAGAEWNITNPTSTEFSVGTDFSTNGSGQTFVAYLFAHDAGGFGDSGNDSVVKCGSFTGTGAANGVTVDLGWEPQWLMIKRTDSSASRADWEIYDNMRGFVTGAALNTGDDARLRANLSDAEGNTFVGRPDATGFTLDLNGTYIYIAIRRGPMKTPTDATKVFNASTYGQNSLAAYYLGAPVDLAMVGYRSGSTNNAIVRQRLTSDSYMFTSQTSAETSSSGTGFAQMFGYQAGGVSPDTTFIGWLFRRAPGFFDVVAWTASASTSITHGLGVAPELIIAKSRSVAGESWTVYTQAGGRSNVLFLNTTNGNTGIANYWGTSGPTTTTFGVAASGSSNNAGNMIAYLFATCPGVSKCFNYTGTGTTLQINCGFTNGARLVLIKRTDSTGDWYIWDSARGIISGNDPYLLLNSTAAEVTNTDYIDPYSAGFEISSTAPAAINANGGSYIGLAIA